MAPSDRTLCASGRRRRLALPLRSEVAEPFKAAFSGGPIDLWPIYERIACPTLVVQGTEDFLVPLGDAWEYEKRIPNATTLILEDTGHVPMLERPRTFNDALMEFLDQTGPAAEPSAADEPTLAQAREGTV